MSRITAAFLRWHAARTRRSNAKANAKRYPTTHPAVTTRKAQP